MSNTNTGGPAFPTNRINIHGEVVPDEEGMALRDYFAAKALPAVFKDYCEAARVDGWDQDWRHEVAAESYQMADAMLKARQA